MQSVDIVSGKKNENYFVKKMFLLIGLKVLFVQFERVFVNVSKYFRSLNGGGFSRRLLSPQVLVKVNYVQHDLYVQNVLNIE